MACDVSPVAMFDAAAHPVSACAYMGSTQAVATQPPLRLTVRSAHTPGCCWVGTGTVVQPAAEAVTPKRPYRAASRNDPGPSPATAHTRGKPASLAISSRQD